MKSYKIHLLRHGLTEANEKGWYLGLTDLPLSPAACPLCSSRKNGAVIRARRDFSPVR